MCGFAHCSSLSSMKYGRPGGRLTYCAFRLSHLRCRPESPRSFSPLYIVANRRRGSVVARPWTRRRTGSSTCERASRCSRLIAHSPGISRRCRGSSSRLSLRSLLAPFLTLSRSTSLHLLARGHSLLSLNNLCSPRRLLNGICGLHPSRSPSERPSL
jgi:hypothetical protein